MWGKAPSLVEITFQYVGTFQNISPMHLKRIGEFYLSLFKPKQQIYFYLFIFSFLRKKFLNKKHISKAILCSYDHRLCQENNFKVSHLPVLL